MQRLIQEWAVLNAKYPLLQPPILKDNKFAITGTLPIVDRNGTIWDNFDVRIDINNDYPASLPVITETGCKIPRDGKWHINRDDTCCVGTTAEQFRKLHQKITILNWVEEFAVPFLANYIYRKETGNYYNGEWSHGEIGIFEDYSQLYGIKDLNLLLQRLRFCSDRQVMSYNELCFCNSGKKYKRCYLVQPESHRHFIPKKVIWHDILLLKKLK
jgi:hypothetical protein